ncbi:MAG TPA: hypothetical protein VFW79_09085 [Cellulomonas sp.]|uniref:hypothetical protein n=1 Tax=Cellulomonas sp. TaxID=40001 RepID=UPI002E2EA3F6|nr:hypothetical protein [Cellulomonas sp.]HEX5332786.1 hypothetical protein [Cellulomonas sp.]
MHPKFLRYVAPATTFVFAAALVLTGGAAVASPGDPTDAVAGIVTGASGSTARTVDAMESGVNTLVAKTASGKVEVDTAPRGSVKLTSGAGATVSIGLPREASTGAARESSDGSIVFAGAPGSADVVVQVSNGSTRISTLIGSGDQSERFTYPLSPDVVPVIEADGSVSLLRKVMVAAPTTGQTVSGNVVAGTIAVPWARDASGVDVPTHYELDGHAIVQVVKHRSAGVTYPVVADPQYSSSWLNSYIWFNHAETATLAAGGWGATGLSAICALAGGPVLAAVCFAAFGSVVYTAGVANNSRPSKCVAVRWTNALVINYITPFTYSGSRCN